MPQVIGAPIISLHNEEGKPVFTVHRERVCAVFADPASGWAVIEYECGGQRRTVRLAGFTLEDVNSAMFTVAMRKLTEAEKAKAKSEADAKEAEGTSLNVEGRTLQ